MYEGIKIQLGGKEIDLNSLPKNANGELVLDDIKGLQIYVDGGAAYDEEMVSILDNNSDIKFSLKDGNGNEIPIVLKGLNDILLGNTTNEPIMEIISGAEKIAFTTIEDLPAAAAGNETVTAEQTGNPAGAGLLDGTDSGNSGERLDGLGGGALGDAVDPTYAYDVTFGGDNLLVLTEDVGQSEEGILSGVITATDPHYGDLLFAAETTTTEYGIFTIDADGNWTYDLFEDNEDIQALNDEQSLLDTITIQIENGEASFIFEITINGLNDQPEIEDINLNDTDIIDIPDDYDGQDYPIPEYSGSALYETHDEIDVIGEDDTKDDGNNIYNGVINVIDIDNENVPTLYIVQNDEDQNDITIDSPLDSDNNPIIGVEDIENISIDFNEETGEWEYNIEANFTELAAGEQATISFQYYADDNRGFSGDPENDDTTDENSISELKTITLTITGTNDKPVVENINLNTLSQYTNENDVDIVDNATVLSTIEITDNATIEDLNVTVDLTHTWVGDIELILVAPDGTEIELVNRLGTSDSSTFGLSDNDFENTTFDDEAGTNIENGTAPFNGTFTPQSDFLSILDGMNIQGIWTLKVIDNAGGDIGTLDYWTLDITTTDGEIKIYETHDETDVIGDDDTQDDGNNILTGTLTVSDDDVNDSHEFFIATDGVTVTDTPVDEDSNPIITLDDLDITINTDGTYSLGGDFSELSTGESATVTVEYYAVDNSSGSEESNESEHKLITFTITGTNDQPEVENVEVSAMETHDAWTEDNWTQMFPYFNPDRDDIGLNDEFNNWIGGTLVATDDDVNDNHYFNLADMTITENGHRHGPGHGHDNDSNQTLVEVNYDTNGSKRGGEGTVDVMFESSDIEADDINITGIYLDRGNGKDSETNFALVGDFDALGAGEVATVTFKYYADDGTSDANGETNISEAKTVTITITGTNDQPEVENVEVSAMETHDAWTEDNWTQMFPYFNPDRDDIGLNDEFNNWIGGTLVATDDDVNDNHYFNLADMTITENGHRHGPGHGHDNDSNQTLVEVNYDTNGSKRGGEGTVDVMFESSDIEADDINITGIYLDRGNGKDSETNFALVGDFDALGAGEVATVTFKYYADDGTSDANGETNISEAKTVTITITGTNDQPEVENVEVSAMETHDAWTEDNWTQMFPYFNPDRDDIGLNDEFNNWIGGTLVATDDDVNDNHYFNLADMTITENGHRHGPGHGHDNDSNQTLVEVNYDTNGSKRGGEGTVDVMFESSDIEADDINITGIYLDRGNGKDSETNFALVGDFDALGAGEVATVTFKYYADDGTSDANGETNISEAKTVTITITGTNDQPEVENVEVSAMETHDAWTEDNWTQMFPYFNPDRDDIGLNDEFNNWIGGTLVATDDDVNDNHYFNLADMTITENGHRHGPGHGHDNDSNQTLVEVNYDTNGSKRGGEGTVDVMFESSDIEADDINITGIYLDRGNGKDSETNFALVGDFDALGAGEVATVTFKYYADDGTSDANGETNISEAKTVTITITGTNDQPEVENVEVSAMETHDAWTEDNWTQMFPYFNPDRDDIGLNDEFNNWIGGTLVATDDDVNDNHYFNLADMTITENGHRHGPGHGHDNDSNQTLVEVNYDTNGSKRGGEGTVDVMFESSDIEADDINITGIYLDRGNGKDSETNFALVGDFDALGAGEVATVTFKYYADDGTSDANGETNISEAKTVTITITGTNDQPVIESITAVSSLETELTQLAGAENARYSGDLETVITMSDEDTNDTYSYVAQTNTVATVVLTNLNGTTEPVTGNTLVNVGTDGKYTVDNATFNNLGARETATVTFEVAITDGTNDTNGETSISETKTVTITITGTNDVPVATSFIHDGPASNDFVWENAGQQTIIDSATDFSSDILSSIAGYDVDLNDTLSVNQISKSDGSNTVTFDGVNATSWIESDNGIAIRINADGKVEYNLNKFKTNGETVFDHLDAGDETQDTFIFNIIDNNGAISNSATATIKILGTNDRPVIDSTKISNLTEINEDILDVDNTGTTILTLLGQAVSDFDDDAVEGIAITGIDNTNGTWQYSLNGTTWVDVNPSVDDTNAIMLYDTASVRFIPNDNYYGSADITYHAWDQTGYNLVNGSTTDITNSNGFKNFVSNETATSTVEVDSVPDFVNWNGTIVNDSTDSAVIYEVGIDDAQDNSETASKTYKVEFVDDTPGTVIFTAANTAPSWLTSGGEKVTYSVSGDGKTLTAIANGETVFTIENDNTSTPSYTVTMFKGIDHVEAGQIAGSRGERQWLSFQVKAEDNDGDSVTSSVNGLSIGFYDDVPTASYTAPIVVDESALNIVIPGQLKFNGGADGAEVTSIFHHWQNANTGTVKIYDGQDGTAFTLTSGGEDVIVTYANNGMTMIGMTNVGESSELEVFRLEAQSDGSYSFIQNAAIDHPLGSTQEDELLLKLKFTVTDTDGDTSTSNFGVKITDTVPTASWERTDIDEASEQVDVGTNGVTLLAWTNDGNILENNNGNNTGGADGSIVETITMKGYYGGVLHAGYDNGSGWVNYNVQSGGEDITLITTPATSTTPHTIIGQTVGSSENVFKIEVDEDGTYHYEQYKVLDHTEDANGDVINIGFKYTLLDADGDRTSGYSDIYVQDDVPVADDDTITKVLDYTPEEIVNVQTIDPTGDTYGTSYFGTYTVVDAGNGFYGIDQSNVSRDIASGDDNDEVDSQGTNEHITFKFDEAVTSADVSFRLLDGDDNISYELFDAYGNAIGSGRTIIVDNSSSANYTTTISSTTAFSSIVFYAEQADGLSAFHWTDFQVGNIIGHYTIPESYNLNNFTIDGDALLVNDSGADGIILKDGTVDLYSGQNVIGAVTFDNGEISIDFGTHNGEELTADQLAAAEFSYTIVDGDGDETTAGATIDLVKGTFENNDGFVVGTYVDDKIEFEQTTGIDGGEGEDTLSFDAADGDIDMASVLDGAIKNADNSETIVRNIEEFDLTSGDHILSNIDANSVLAMTDNDNELLIKGDSGDTIKLDLATDNSLSDGEWFRDTTLDDGSSQAYIGKSGDETITLLINGINVDEI